MTSDRRHVPNRSGRVSASQEATWGDQVDGSVSRGQELVRWARGVDRLPHVLERRGGDPGRQRSRACRLRLAGVGSEFT